MDRARLIEKCAALFKLAAQHWEHGNNSGDPRVLARGENMCLRLRRQAEELLEDYGIECDYPGLYPTFVVRGRSYTALPQALDAAGVK